MRTTQKPENFAIFNIISFIFGVFLSLFFAQNLDFYKISFAILLLLLGIFGFIRQRKPIFITFFLLFLGFFYANLHQKIAENYQPITGKIFVDVIGEVEDVSEFYNSVNKTHGLSLKISSPEFFKSKFVAKNKKPQKKKRKISKSFIKRNFHNIENLQEIDEESLRAQKNYQNPIFVKNENGDEVYQNPPPKIRIFVTKFVKKPQIGDQISFKAVLMPFQKPTFLNSFDFGFYNLSQNVAAQGYAISEIEILQEKQEKFTLNFNFFKKIRAQISQKITEANLENGGIAKALLIGDKKEIPQEKYEAIKDSGLAHLVAISGLHLSLSAAIFFFLSRFLFSQSEFLTLRFNIKKFAAITAICAAFAYLQIAGAPISAKRAFLMVLLFMIAILFDRKGDLKRIVAFAGLFMILLNPNNLFLVSFQLSFAAVLGIVVFGENLSNFVNKNALLSKIKKSRAKILIYIFELMAISVIAQIVTMPFLIYHFSDVAVYGFISNLIAIPLTSFLIMRFRMKAKAKNEIMTKNMAIFGISKKK